LGYLLLAQIGLYPPWIQEWSDGENHIGYSNPTLLDFQSTRTTCMGVDKEERNDKNVGAVE